MHINENENFEFQYPHNMSKYMRNILKCKLNILIHHEYKLNILKYDKYT